jgi:RecB family endonuclease NucS
MTGEDIEKGFQEIWELFRKTDKEIEKTNKAVEETSKTVEETSKTVKETSKAVNRLTGKWSLFVEGLIAPAAERLFKEREIEVDKVYQRVKTHRNGDTMEIDILAVNGQYAVVIEAKSSLSIDDVKEHVDRLEQFKRYFPEYKERKVIGAVGGIVIEEGADRYAYKKGMFVIAERGETVKIANDKEFKPKIW